MYIIGTAGFFYKDWIEKFYPKDISWSKWINYYSEYFNGLEVNSSFYKIPSSSTIVGLKKLELNYIFKIYRFFTHFKKYDKKVLNEFLKNLQLLKQIGKLRGFLFQFPSRASKSQIFECLNFIREKEKELDFFLELRDIKLIYEFKNEKIINQLKKIKTSLVYVDGRFRNDIIIYKWEDLGFSKCYFRLHGRGEKLYNRLYSEEELDEIVKSIKNICKNKEECYIFFNNTTKAQAVQNALYIKKLLEGKD